MMRTKTLATLAVTAIVVACSPVQDTKTADAAIAAFHQKLNAQDFAGIYSAAAPELKASATEDALAGMLATIHGKLGAFQSGSDTGWKDDVETGGHSVSITYSAKYDHGEAEESFVYRIEGGQAQLAGYHVKAPALIGE